MRLTLHAAVAVLGVMLSFLQTQFPLIMAGCPLILNGSNFTLLASMCSNLNDRGKCCRYINAFVAVIIARHSNVTGDLGVASGSSEVCLHTISQTFKLYGVPQNATEFCGLGTKIPITYECRGRTTITQMAQSPGFGDVTNSCVVPVVQKSDCRKCINASILYLHDITGAEDNVTLNSCRDATFAALASRVDDASAAGFAGCFFHTPGLSTIVSAQSSSAQNPRAPPSQSIAAGPSEPSVGLLDGTRRRYHLTVLPAIGIAVTVISLTLLGALLFFIRRKSKELEDSKGNIKTSMGASPRPPRPLLKIQEGPSSVFRKFTYKETKKATNSFSTVIGQGGFGTVYKADFSDGLVAAVKRMDRISEQAEDEFCREIELVARLHHRHLVALKGFCIQKHERFLMYEYLENGCLKDHLHSPGSTSLSWQLRIQIAIDVANALVIETTLNLLGLLPCLTRKEYLHFYCDPPLCHRDIKSSNILLDENFVAKVADFGLAHASKDGTVCFEPINTDVRGTPGYMDPEYVVTRGLTEKSDIYSYGVVLLELVTGRRAIQENKNLVEWSKPYLASETRLPEIVDPTLGDNFDFDQLKTLIEIAEWCTHVEGRSRPSIKQVLRLLYESSDPIHNGFLQAVEDEEGISGRRRISGKGKSQRTAFHSGEGGYFPSSSSTTRSYCSRSFLLENGSPQSPPNIPSI